MKERQKVLLALCKGVQGNVTPTQLVKWSFLASEETDIRSRIAFYDYLPYKFGPYSFLLRRELNELRSWGYVFEEQHSVRVSATLSTESDRLVASLPRSVSSSVESVLNDYSDLSHNQLIDYVYGRYAWYASRSELRPAVRDAAPLVNPMVYTLGYEGESIDAFFAKVIASGIKQIIDVRKNPFSRKYGFAGRTLSGIASKMRVKYIHIPELGIESALRREIGSEDDRALLFEYYRTDILPDSEDHVRRASEHIRTTPSALLCFESDPLTCHRSVLAKEIASITDMEVKHL